MWKVGKLAIRKFPSLCCCCVIDNVLSVPYAALAKSFALIEATTKRIEKTSLLTSLMLLVIQRSKAGDTDSLLRTVYLCINRVRFSLFVLCVALSVDSDIYYSLAQITRVSSSESVRACSSRQ
jgi:hypothetical protein